MPKQESLSRNRISQILLGCKSKQAAVVGDFCLDAYWYADMTRSELSRETPRFPLPVVKELYSPGGAGNVSANLTALGLRGVFAITVFGKDWRGEILKNSLTSCGVSLDFALTLPGQVTPTYIKPILQGYASTQEDSRIDFEPVALPPEAEDILIEKVKACLSAVDAIAIADQVTPGIVTPKVRQALSELARIHPDKIFIADSRKNAAAFTDMILKPNELEASMACGIPVGQEDLYTMRKAGKVLQAKARRPVYITLGERGSLLFEGPRIYTLPAVPTEPPIDIVGAGDSFLAALCASLASGAAPWEAGMIASLASSVVIKKLNTTGTATPEEILARYDSIPSEWNMEVQDGI